MHVKKNFDDMNILKKITSTDVKENGGALATLINR